MIEPVNPQGAGAVAQVSPPAVARNSGRFADALDEALQRSGDVRFSAHAMQRLQDRNIELTAADRARIARSTDMASAKGSRESLLLMDRLALVVGVPTRTVITVMEPHSGESTVFTNIDSVVMVADDGAATNE